jgi:hypothetical protein
MSLSVRFVEPRPGGHNVYDHILLPRLGLPLMATMLAEGGHDTGVFCEMLGPIDLGECLAAARRPPPPSRGAFTSTPSS